MTITPGGYGVAEEVAEKRWNVSHQVEFELCEIYHAVEVRFHTQEKLYG
jgi:hypothetical protein